MKPLARAAVLLFAFALPVAAQTSAIEGVVTAAGGVPVAGALVSAVSSQEMRPEAFAIAGTATTDAQGHFRIGKLKAGKYAVTATHPAHVAAFLEPKAVGDGATLKADPVMGSEGRKFTGEAFGPDGKPVAAKIVAARFSPHDGDLFVVQTDSSGKFSTMLPAARYVAIVTAPGMRGDQRFDLETADQDLRISLERSFGEAPAEAVAWIRRNAIPLKTAEAGHGFDDMKPLERIVGNARVVALGEATHGTREFFQLKHRMLEFLVERMGFTVFAIEASTPDTLPVNDYVLHGKGDVVSAVEGMGFWTWSTAEVVEMAKWMRRYNEDPKHTRKLKFLGFDMQSPMSSVRLVKAYLERVDPEFAKGIAPEFDPLKNRGEYGKNAEGQKRVQSALQGIAARLEQSRDAYIARSSAAEWADARRQLDLVRQGDEYFRTGGPETARVRDRWMAENAKWTLEQEPAGTKIVLWAHNLHVGALDAAPFGGMTMMGSHLRRMFGNDVRIFGFAFDRGSFRAVDPKQGLIDHTVGAAPKDSFDAALAAAGIPLFALDLRGATGAVKEWLAATMPARSIGAVFVSGNELQHFTRVPPAAMYDAVFFVANTTPAKPAREQVATRVPSGRKGENLDFEKSVAGEMPRGWTRGGNDSTFIAVATDQGCAGGRLCLRIERKPDAPGDFASFAQFIDATPYRGKKVRLRAKVRSNVDGSARLWLRVDLPKGRTGFFDNMDNRMPKSLPEWTELEITGDVAADAEAVAFGMLFTGSGTAWMDDVSLEAVP